MEEIAWSTEGKKLMVEAAEAGLPALAGIEPLIVADLGPLYHPHDLGTADAGSIVGQVMRHLGYELGNACGFRGQDRSDMASAPQVVSGAGAEAELARKNGAGSLDTPPDHRR
ncbi:MAG: hypothetical protein E5X80_03230 [Mesorhizobium sp.]|uniref:hypothetical protein n=1 Tax=Mesorhizobium sp. TaxID=1871066 RepID=UPI000FE8B00B|nr:hypothetical protein [Mesorhizobium sp.]RWL98466.1 MAG: hypothetical protein EOR71_31370 [Mesorhizobium sp.]TIO53532.1 MAG: hypothetical protein E5X78_08020 [Mesorhizobium sp.]TIO62305.1 MAG: hypothetical protein E5X79_03355 [Mesorhizobium sp.]TJV67023.1 MAG: hypothetical protein E5X80_03230 [Mesorhizobium sp.]